MMRSVAATPMSAEMSSSSSASTVSTSTGRERQADVPMAAEVAGAREHQIAETAQAGERFASAASRARQARQLGEAARDERRQRVVSESQTFDDAGGDRDDVLERAANLHADHILDTIESK